MLHLSAFLNACSTAPFKRKQHTLQLISSKAGRTKSCQLDQTHTHTHTHRHSFAHTHSQMWQRGVNSTSWGWDLSQCDWLVMVAWLQDVMIKTVCVCACVRALIDVWRWKDYRSFYYHSLLFTSLQTNTVLTHTHTHTHTHLVHEKPH